MSNTPYVDDRCIYDAEEGVVYRTGKKYPATIELITRAKEQLESQQILDEWIKIDHNDKLKLRFLGEILSNDFMFYDMLSNIARNQLASELYSMSEDEINFENQNRDYFKKIAEYIISNIKDTQSFFEYEIDFDFAELVKKFKEYNYREHGYENKGVVTK